jgi:anti-sigma-K factor RskA
VNNCEEARELIGAYSIGATDVEETRLVEDALDDCPELVDELAEYASMMTAMHEAVPLRYTAPPVSRLFADLKPAQPLTLAVESKVAKNPQRRLWWISIAALFVVTALAVGSNLLWLNRVNELEAAQQLQLTQQPTRSPLAIMFDPAATHQRVLLPTSDENGAMARVIWNSEFEVGSLFVIGLDPLPPDMAYQLWAVRADETLSLGQFNVDNTGTGILIFQSPEPIVSFDALGISPEPASGSDAPTHDHVVVGNI